MTPTYTTNEALKLMEVLDYEGLIILGEVITEEKKRYSLNDLRFLKDTWEVWCFMAQIRKK
jgi:hypothetical protein